MRGKPASRDKHGSGRRITPAGAGKTRCLHQPAAVSTDHPRRCGENPVLHDFRAVSTGSPPQVRGKPEGFTKYFTASRITPAGAGKTFHNSLRKGNNKDHPRRCGENSFLIYFSKPIAGSPPQVRGKHYPSKNRFPYYRITPAGAGKTYYRRMVQLRLQDHPRRCGENDSLKKHIAEIAGSPPQVRGKPSLLTYPRSRRRITPAGAGKTTFG